MQLALKFTKDQLNYIVTLNPLENSKFMYETKRWKSIAPALKEQISQFAEKEISRNDIIKAYKAYFQGRNINFEVPIILTFIWGFANTGYGEYRTLRIINSKSNRQRIVNALQYVDEDSGNGIENAFRELNMIKGLGVSYISKVLYFATRAKQIKKYALIYDSRVAHALILEFTPKSISDIVTIFPKSDFTSYCNYIDLIHRIAKENKVDPEQVEWYLFNGR